MFSSKDTCYYKLTTFRNLPICAFDFDETLVELHKTNIMANVLETLVSLYQTHDIVIFSIKWVYLKGKLHTMKFNRDLSIL